MKQFHVLIAVALTAHCLVLSAQDWPQYNGPSQAAPIIEGTVAGLSADAVWTAQVGTGFSAVSIADGFAYTMGNQDDQDSVVCLNEKTGAEVWRHSYACKLNPRLYKGGPNATPTIVDGKVYTLSREGHVFCLSAKDGAVLWQRQIAQEEGYALPGFGFSGSPLVVKDMLVLNAGADGLALSLADGKTLWKSGAGKAGYASPMLYDEKTVLIYGEFGLSALNLSDGKRVWHFPWKTKYGINSPMPIVKGQQIFISSGYGMGCALIDVSGGEAKQIWKNKTLECQMCGPVLIGDHLYGVSAYRSKPGELRCVEFATGKQVWSQGGFGHGAVIAVGETLIVQAEKGAVALVKADAGAYTELARQQLLSDICWTQPSVANGNLFVRNAPGKVLCVPLK